MTFKGTGLAAAVALIMALAGCSNQPVDTSSNTFILDTGSMLFAKLRRAPQQDFKLTRAQLAGVDVSLLWVEVLSSDATGSALAIARNRDAVTWITANEVTLITKDGVIFGTRGLGPDLLTTETDRARNAISRQTSDRYPRTYRFIDGDESIRKERYFCELDNDGPEIREILEVRHNTIQMRESCYALHGPRVFRNVYWVGSDGTIWESLQWISPQAGYLRVQRLIR